MTTATLAPIEFRAFPKIPRLFRDCVITEKIDGTNAAVVVADDGTVSAQSRNRSITVDDDNYGFAAWVTRNAWPLVSILGPGYHYGEWWGGGIQRGYGLAKDDKRFSLFNVARWGESDLSGVPGLGLVLMDFTFSTAMVSLIVDRLREYGSQAAPGFMRPEGVIVWHEAARQMFKVTLEKDDEPKSQARP